MAVETHIGGPNDGGDRYGDDYQGGLIELIAKYDKSDQELLHALGEAAADPQRVADINAAISFRAQTNARRWADVVTALAEEYGGIRDEEFIGALSVLWLDAEAKRAEALNKLSPDGEIEPIADGQLLGLKAIVREIVDQNSGYEGVQDGDILNGLIKLYAECLEKDVNRFIGSLSTLGKAESPRDAKKYPKQRFYSMLPELGRRAAQAAAIAAGVAGGILFARLFGRHK